ncbi:hypothetical protein WSS_A35933 [Rhodococcus opacus M213]|uniref:Uncharacterized protein n=2 Tax=Rhodococcus opacus TaxID=37919 RepID=K8X843_RHOOP|nr:MULTISPECIES: hypothetical protein [Rhodococcus]ANS26121.1 hypothetical protein R1CP_07000 [Rhodococcus opacus]EKT77739.1 hypothetical protein WSS_A35933 [Rhodococcus opacus M213]UOT05538.1 DUF3237 domain-containing protein [Rhodococcus opacus]GLK38217.1 hypothetical protein GCM10017611_50820 [Rhodococcus wratislaviensis]
MTELLAPAPPGMSFLATFVVEVAEPVEIGSTPEGTRRIIPITPRLTAAEGRWSWLRSRILVGTGERLPGEVRLTVFVVD